MKAKSISFLYLATIMLTLSLSACAETKSTNKTSGKISSKSYPVEQFNSIKQETVANIIFTQGEPLSLRVEGIDSDIENLQVTFKNGELKLQSKKEKKKEKVNLMIFITAPDLVRIEQEGVGTFTLKDKVELQNLEIDYEGVGNLEADDLQCQNLNVEFQGVGNMKLNGSAVNAKIKTEGVGSMDTKNFEVDHLIIKASGVGSVKCKANKTIDITSEGVGTVKYWGDAEIKSIRKDGIGKITKGK